MWALQSFTSWAVGSEPKNKEENKFPVDMDDSFSIDKSAEPVMVTKPGVIVLEDTPTKTKKLHLSPAGSPEKESRNEIEVPKTAERQFTDVWIKSPEYFQKPIPDDVESLRKELASMKKENKELVKLLEECREVGLTPIKAPTVVTTRSASVVAEVEQARKEIVTLMKEKQELMDEMISRTQLSNQYNAELELSKKAEAELRYEASRHEEKIRTLSEKYANLDLEIKQKVLENNDLNLQLKHFVQENEALKRREQVREYESKVAEEDSKESFNRLRVDFAAKVEEVNSLCREKESILCHLKSLEDSNSSLKLNFDNELASLFQERDLLNAVIAEKSSDSDRCKQLEVEVRKLASDYATVEEKSLSSSLQNSELSSIIFEMKKSDEEKSRNFEELQASLHLQLSTYEVNQQDLLNQISAYKLELAEVSKLLNDSNSELKVSELESSRMEYLSQIELLKQNEALVVSDLQSLRDQNENMQKTINGSEKLVCELTDKIETLKVGMQDRINELVHSKSESISSMQKELDNILFEKQTLESRLLEVDKTGAFFNEKIASFEILSNNLQRDNGILRNNCEEFQNRVKQLENVNADLLYRYDELKFSFQEVEQQNSGLKASLDDFDSFKSDNIVLQQSKEELILLNQELKADLLSLKVNMESLLEKMGQLNDICQNKDEENSNLLIKLNSISNENEILVAEIASLKSSLSLLESKLVSNEEKLENYSTQILVNERIISDLKISFDTESNQKSTFVSNLELELKSSKSSLELAQSNLDLVTVALNNTRLELDNEKKLREVSTDIQMNNFAAEISNLKTRLFSNEALCESYKSELSELTDKIADLQHKIGEKDLLIKQLESASHEELALENLRATNESLVVDLKEKSNLLIDLKRQLYDFSIEVDNLRCIETKSSYELNDLKFKLALASEELETNNKHRNQILESEQNVSKELIISLEELSIQKSLSLELQMKVENSNRELEKYKKLLDDEKVTVSRNLSLETHCSNLLEKIANLEKQIEVAETDKNLNLAAIEEANKRASFYSSEFERVSAELNECSGQIFALRDELSKGFILQSNSTCTKCNDFDELLSNFETLKSASTTLKLKAQTKISELKSLLESEKSQVSALKSELNSKSIADSIRETEIVNAKKQSDTEVSDLNNKIMETKSKFVALLKKAKVLDSARQKSLELIHNIRISSDNPHLITLINEIDELLKSSALASQPPASISKTEIVVNSAETVVKQECSESESKADDSQKGVFDPPSNSDISNKSLALQVRPSSAKKVSKSIVSKPSKFKSSTSNNMQETSNDFSSTTDLLKRINETLEEDEKEEKVVPGASLLTDIYNMFDMKTS